MSHNKDKVLIIYHSFAHYRAAVVEALAASDKYHFVFCASAESYDPSIKLMTFPDNIEFEHAGLSFLGPFMRQKNLSKVISKHDYKAVIFLGNPYILSYWIPPIKLRLKGVSVLFWTHGWVNAKDTFLKRTVRNTFYRLGHALLLYGHRAKRLGLEYGFRDEDMFVISNSLDFNKMSATFANIKTQSKAAVRQTLNIPIESQVLICSARLIPACRFDLLIRAAASLRAQGQNIYVLLIGEGDMRESLVTLAEELSVPLQLTGACYDEDLIAQYFHASDVAVSPGKVGLSVIHSLTYETPMITNDNFDIQGPESEAIEPDVTGDFFKENDLDDLTHIISKWLRYTSEPNNRIGQQCFDKVRNGFSPQVQRREIENAIERVTS